MYPFHRSMKKQPASTYLGLANWLVKASAILAIIVLVTAFQSAPVAAPAPERETSLVSFALFSLPTEPIEAVQAAPVEPTLEAPVRLIALETPTSEPTAAPLAFVEPVTPEPSDALVPRRMPVILSTPDAALELAVPLPFDGNQRVARVPILMYHYISDPPPGADSLRRSLSVTPANLDAQMNWLKQAGYQTITLYDLYDFLMQGKPLPAMPIILTFDDGYVDAFQFATPILQKHGCVGTFFVLTGPADRLGAGGYLNWAQIQAMSDAGMDMELHSREHVDLRYRPNDFLVHQIAGGRESIEGHTGRPVRWFAYPSGQYDAAVVRVLQSAGFWGSVTTMPGRTHTAAGLFDLQRVRVFGSETLEGFIKLVAGN
jgi:peptidoglycan/xylan/chitin deacetylase (PgdA/CDA1 family)